MTGLAQQHERWAAAHSRLWSSPAPVHRPRPTPRLLPPVVRPAEPHPLVGRWGWPPYQIPLFYDHCEAGGIVIVPPRKPMRRIIGEVALKYGFSLNDLISERRTRDVVTARHEAFWRCREETTFSLVRIGRAFRRDHTTVIHGIKMHEKRLLEAVFSTATMAGKTPDFVASENSPEPMKDRHSTEKAISP